MRSASPLVAWLLVLALTFLHARARAETVAGATALASRLNAPCCFGGTLDIHESDLARTLRAEIASRLASGESSETIQSDFVARYGPKVVAARSDAPLRGMGVGIGIAAVVAAAGLVVLARRWTRRDSQPAGVTTPARDGALDARIDAELAALDD